MREQGEISRNGVIYIWSLLSPDMVTVRAPDGRRKTTQVGGSPPEVLAKIMARELEEDGGGR